MLTFLDGENSEAYQIATNLDERLRHTGHLLNYYQILGLNFDFDKKELNDHYCQLKKIMDDSDNFKEEEKDLIDEAHRRFTSFLGAVWYEKDISSCGVNNARLQYESMVEAKKMFKNLNEKIGKKLVINYIEKKDNGFVENKIVGTLKESCDFNNIIFECVNDFNIDFLGQHTAVLQICDMSGNKIYSNQYLLDPKKRILYSDDETVINGFRIASWGFYAARILAAMEQKKLSNGKCYTKKI